MRRCFYHTDLRQNAVFHNFARQIGLIQYSGRSKQAWAFSETVQKMSKITYTASRFSDWPNLQSEPLIAWMNINRVTLQHNKEFIMFIFYFKTV